MFGVADGATEKEPSLDEINARMPRRVRLSADGSSGLQAALVFLLGGLIWLGGVTAYMVHQWRIHDTLDREGLDASAQVTGIGYARDGDSVYYMFHVGGAEYRNDVRLVNARIPAVGSLILVVYLPSDPTVNYPKGMAWWDLDYLVLYALGGMAVYFGVQLAWGLFRDWRLARHGWVTEGKVSLCVAAKSRFMVDYEFRTPNDELVEGSNNDCYDEYKTDAKIRVIYLRNRPERNSSYPLETVEMVEDAAPVDPFKGGI